MVYRRMQNKCDSAPMSCLKYPSAQSFQQVKQKSMDAIVLDSVGANGMAMEWIVVSPQIHTMFSSLGIFIGDNYVVNPSCYATLTEIWRRLLVEDRILRTFRRAIGVSQVIKKDLLPLLINNKDDCKIINLTIKMLANLTMPVECLLPMQVMSKTDAGRNTIYELNLFLKNCKEAFLDPRSTKKILDHIKTIMDQKDKLTREECDTINDCILLLRNLLQIPDFKNGTSPTSIQNQILWNIFAQSLDKRLVEIITSKYRGQWSLIVVQLIALMYKDQHASTLQKMLNLWFEASLSESSEDNESNTSPPDRDSGDSSSSMATNDPTSDSSDNNTASDQKMEADFQKEESDGSRSNSNNSMGCYMGPAGFCTLPIGISHYHSGSHRNSGAGQVGHHLNSHQGMGKTGSKGNSGKRASSGQRNKVNKQNSKQNHFLASNSNSTSASEFKPQKMECGSSEVSDCGYGTQLENQESISTSSNDDETPNTKPVHQKPANMIQKSRHASNKPQTIEDKQDLKRKKLIRRSRLNSVKALLHHIPTDEDISHLLKEFTVDFLLKGYGCLVSQLHYQLMYDENAKTVMDSSHFFWLISYFLKFATQLELDLELISPVLCADIMFYLTYEGVLLSEQFELAKSQSDTDVSPCVRGLHLVVTAIRELITTFNSYKKVGNLSSKDKEYLETLQKQLCDTDDLRSLFVLLLRQFTPTVQSKQYLQDVIVTNHMLLMFLENSHLPGSVSALHRHMRLFLSVDMMCQYGLLLECFEENGQFVNDCIFTMMHHVAGDLDHVSALFQPPILKTFSLIWESDFQLCDDWSDLIEYVIHKFINIPRPAPLLERERPQEATVLIPSPPAQRPSQNWSQEDCHNLYWYYVQSASSKDPVGAVIDLYCENGVDNKIRIEVIEKLLEQDIITRPQYQELMAKEPLSMAKNMEQSPDHTDSGCHSECLDEIETLKDNLMKDNKEEFLIWVQRALLETCQAKMAFIKKSEKIIEPVPYYCTLKGEAVPLVAWSGEQWAMVHSGPFALLLHKIGLVLPADAGTPFPRIPPLWGPDELFAAAVRLGPLRQEWLKFDAAEMQTSVKECHEDPVIEPPYSCLPSPPPPYIPFTPDLNLGTKWMDLARTSKKLNLSKP